MTETPPPPARALDETTHPHIIIGADECPTHFDREALYHQFQPLVSNLIRRYGKDAELRQDLRSEIYYRFCCLVDSYDPQRGIPLVAYVTRMLSQRVFNYARDYWRASERHQLTTEDILNQQPANTPAPEDCIERLYSQEVAAALPAAIARLPHRQRLVLVWRYYDGRSFAEMAAELGVKEATVRSLLRHAMNALRQRMVLPPAE
jgi:RNA polymerase sigma-70 factor (ECF subfamily)